MSRVRKAARQCRQAVEEEDSPENEDANVLKELVLTLHCQYLKPGWLFPRTAKFLTGFQNQRQKQKAQWLVVRWLGLELAVKVL